MPRYEFSRDDCGPFDLWRSFAEVSVTVTCPLCTEIARRVYTRPGLVKTARLLVHALDHAHKSASAPEVVKRERFSGEERPSTTSVQQQHTHGRPWQLSH